MRAASAGPQATAEAWLQFGAGCGHRDGGAAARRAVDRGPRLHPSALTGMDPFLLLEAEPCSARELVGR